MAATIISQEEFNALATSTIRRYDTTLQDNIFTATPVLNLMRERGRMREIPGGRQIAPGLLYEANSTVLPYSGADVLDTTYQDGMTRAFYDWRFYNVSTVITDEEVDINAGSKEKLFDLLDEKFEQTEMSLVDEISADLFKIQAGKRLDGFRSLIGDSAGTVGQINESNEAWWAPQRQTSGVNSLNLKEKLTTLYNDANKGVSNAKAKKYFWVSTQGVHEELESQIEDRARYTLTDDFKKIGFGLEDVIHHKGRPFIWDEDADGGDSDERVWLLNTEFLYLVVHPKRKFSTGAMRTPVNQHISVAHTRFMGNQVTNHRRALGVSHDITL